MRATSLADRLAHPPEVAEIAGQDVSDIDALEAAGLFPLRIMLPGGGHGWRLSEIVGWAQDRRHRQAICGGGHSTLQTQGAQMPAGAENDAAVVGARNGTVPDYMIRILRCTRHAGVGL